MAPATPLVELWRRARATACRMPARWPPRPAERSRPRFDAVLMMHGAAGTLAEPFYRNFSAALTARGVATLRANNRGHEW